jgi:hypothetical protein
MSRPEGRQQPIMAGPTTNVWWDRVALQYALWRLTLRFWVGVSEG